MSTESRTCRRYRHAGHVCWRRVDQGAVILDLENSAYFSLNEVGAFIWQKLGAGETLDSVEASICQDYGVEKASAQQDSKKLLSQLIRQRLIEPRSS